MQKLDSGTALLCSSPSAAVPGPRPHQPGLAPRGCPPPALLCAGLRRALRLLCPALLWPDIVSSVGKVSSSRQKSLLLPWWSKGHVSAGWGEVSAAA